MSNPPPAGPMADVTAPGERKDMDRREWATQPELRMNAYYYGFRPTGVRAVDEILSAVACAGKAYHHTDAWCDGYGDEPSYVELIQEAADRAANLLREKPTEPSL